ncbi:MULTISPECIES: glycosyltransferase family 2 protein [Paraburkholderia]|uniref:Glycosyltransferase family 2 protein n=1 Tax=Paraburkholderia azotifigens TaxID=2057004 RepID=A0ABU9QZL2_9BURK|nr:glycosyltransferase family 2 protein [Paraburkholderia hospita]OUL82337.1 glycosyltransferase [Paraburkholderia hospita]
MEKIKIAVVTPVFNEEQVIGHFHARTRAVLDSMPDVDGKIIFVLDRSTDDSRNIIRSIVDRDANARLIVLSSRFGHQMSLLAGIERSLDADAIVMMDSDLQQPPELIPKMIDAYRKGFDVVFTTRKDNEDASFIRKKVGNLFYRLLARSSTVEITANAADFRLISNRVADILVHNFEEQNVFLRGIIPWIGFDQTGIEYVAEPRFAGKSKYSLSRMIKLATAGILSFSTKPLQIGIFVGVGFAALAFLMSVYAVIDYFVDRTIPSGWTTLAVLLLLFSGIQLIVMGVLGAYVGGIYEEVKRRPRYIVDEDVSHD